MPDIFTLPKAVSLAGAKLYFRQTNTSTAQDVYTDIDLQVAHTQPVEADAAGVFPVIYFDPTLPDYRVRLETSAGVLIYQVDDIPSNQNVQQSMRLESTNPNVFLYDSDGTSGSRKYRIRAAGAAFEVQASNEAESVFTTILRYESGVLYSNETEVAVTISGSFTATLTGMAAATTGTVYYRKVNNIVSLWITALIAGTSNSTSLTMSGLPDAIQPSATVFTNCTVTDASNTGLLGQAAVLDTGSITFLVAKTDVVTDYVKFDASGFTNTATTKGLPSGWCITYPVF